MWTGSSQRFGEQMNQSTISPSLRPRTDATTQTDQLTHRHHCPPPLHRVQGCLRRAVCPSCRPLVEYLRSRVASLETASTCQPSNLSAQGQLLALQIRLKQASDHIDYLNEILKSKGQLNSGYNYEAHSTLNDLAQGPCSMDGLKYYECDGDSDGESWRLESAAELDDDAGTRPLGQLWTS